MPVSATAANAGVIEVGSPLTRVEAQASPQVAYSALFGNFVPPDAGAVAPWVSVDRGSWMNN